ncbi:hypothetical protein EON62_06655, partial [archaeon]
MTSASSTASLGTIVRGTTSTSAPTTSATTSGDSTVSTTSSHGRSKRITHRVAPQARDAAKVSVFTHRNVVPGMRFHVDTCLYHAHEEAVIRDVFVRGGVTSVADAVRKLDVLRGAPVTVELFLPSTSFATTVPVAGATAAVPDALASDDYVLSGCASAQATFTWEGKSMNARFLVECLRSAQPHSARRCFIRIRSGAKLMTLAFTLNIVAALPDSASPTAAHLAVLTPSRAPRNARGSDTSACSSRAEHAAADRADASADVRTRALEGDDASADTTQACSIDLQLVPIRMYDCRPSQLLTESLSLSLTGGHFGDLQVTLLPDECGSRRLVVAKRPRLDPHSGNDAVIASFTHELAVAMSYAGNHNFVRVMGVSTDSSDPLMVM